jgi:hypothetical protein
MSFLREHPIVTLLIGIGVGMAFGSQITRLPFVGGIAGKVTKAA